jgi:alcohol dehydrogenase (cytochrome c)
MYFPLQNTCSHVTATNDSRTERSTFGMRGTGSEIAPGTTNVGSIHAISTVTGHTDWKYEQRAATTSLLTTGGGLLFGGDVGGRFRAYDQRTGKVVWEVNLGSQVTGFPVSFAVDGRQYIAASTGQAILAGGFLALAPEIRVGSTNALYVFALPDGTRSTRATPRRAAVETVAAAPAPASALPNCSDMKQAATGPLPNAVSPDGRFTHAQGEAGRKLFVEQQCSLCHGPAMGGTPGAPSLKDADFRGAWQGRTVEALYSCAKSTMPPGRAGTLSDAQYVELIAAILEANGIKPGDAPLPADAAEMGRIVLDAGR